MRLLLSLLFFGFLLPVSADAQNGRAGNVRINNRTGAQINLLYVTPPTKGWGDDMLGTDVYLANAAQHTVDLSTWGAGNCTFDIKASDENSNEYYVWGKNLCTNRNLTIDATHLLVTAPPAEPEIEAENTEGNTVFRNNHSESVFYLYAVPATRGSVDNIEWGTDLLGDGTLSASDTFSAEIDKSDECVFDVKAEGEGNAMIQVLRRVNLCENSEVTIGGGEEAEAVDSVEKTFEVENSTGESILYLKISSPGDDNYGEDLLGDETILDGDALTVSYTTQDDEACIVDLKAERSPEDTIVVLESVNICNGETLKIGAGLTDENSIIVKNEATATIYYLYISKSTNWGDDRLGDEVIIGDGEERIKFEDASGSNCRFNIKAEGSEHVLIKTLRNVNLCTTREITIR